MSMLVPQLRVDNCPRCGNVYQRNLRNQCERCSTSLDDLLRRSILFLQRNYRATNEQLCEVIGSTQLQVHAWIKAGKLHLSDYPNLNYPCGSCAEPIRMNKLCTACSTRISREIRQLNVPTPMVAPQPIAERQQGISGGFRIRDRWTRV